MVFLLYFFSSYRDTVEHHITPFHITPTVVRLSTSSCVLPSWHVGTERAEENVDALNEDALHNAEHFFPSAIFTGGKKNIREVDKPGGEGVGNKTKKKNNHKQNLLLWAKTASTEKNTVGTMYSPRLGLDSITPFVGAAMAETL